MFPRVAMTRDRHEGLMKRTAKRAKIAVKGKAPRAGKSPKGKASSARSPGSARQRETNKARVKKRGPKRAPAQAALQARLREIEARLSQAEIEQRQAHARGKDALEHQTATARIRDPSLACSERGVFWAWR